jgi:hypothetical protein
MQAFCYQVSTNSLFADELGIQHRRQIRAGCVSVQATSGLDTLPEIRLHGFRREADATCC